LTATGLVRIDGRLPGNPGEIQKMRGLCLTASIGRLVCQRGGTDRRVAVNMKLA
jgi:hypothetical protein